MERNEIVDLIKRELPVLMLENEEIESFIVRLSRKHFADRQDTNGRFDQLLEELKRDREEQSKKWDEQNKKWWKQSKKWDEQDKKWGEQNQKWYLQHEEIMQLSKKIDSSIGALGARWGIASEASFRNGLKAILKDSFGVEVLNITDYDEEGQVFGRPDQVELDIIIKDGVLIICEIKSSMSKSDMYIFERKARFYEQRHNRKADRLMVISPMIDNRAMDVAKTLQIECYSYANQVSKL